MSGTIEFLDGLLEERLSNLHTALLGKITSIEVEENRAHVQPLQGGLPLLVNLPLVKQTYKVTIPGGSSAGEYICTGPHYEVGDTVLVVFLERARDGIGDRKHDLSDGVIIGILA